MNPAEVAKMLDVLTAVAESLGGLRKQLIAQGFPADIADQIIVETVKKQGAPNE